MGDTIGFNFPMPHCQVTLIGRAFNNFQASKGQTFHKLTNGNTSYLIFIPLSKSLIQTLYFISTKYDFIYPSTKIR